MTYDPDPPAATLYRNGQPVGVTPVTLGYARDPAFAEGRCVRIDGASVRWASGATASVPALDACPAEGHSRTYTFVRPDVPGRDVDLGYALEHQRNAIRDRQSQAGQDAITSQIMNTLAPP